MEQMQKKRQHNNWVLECQKRPYKAGIVNKGTARGGISRISRYIIFSRNRY